jgi:hypothetical protein
MPTVGAETSAEVAPSGFEEPDPTPIQEARYCDRSGEINPALQPAAMSAPPP